MELHTTKTKTQTVINASPVQKEEDKKKALAAAASAPVVKKTVRRTAPKKAKAKKAAAPGGAAVLAPPAVKVKKSFYSKLKASLHLESHTDKAKKRVGEDKAALKRVKADAEACLKEFRPKKKLSSHSVTRREKMYYRKKDCKTKADAITVNYAEILENKEQEALAAKTGDTKKFIKMLRNMSDSGINFMSFKNDENFLKHYQESMNDLTDYAALSPVLMRMTQDDIDALNKSGKVKLPPIEKLQDMAMSYVYVKEWYEAKLDQLKTNAYLSLKDTDTVGMKPDELTEAKDKLIAKGNTDLAKYLDAQMRMNKAEELGAVHIGGSDRSKWRSWGNSGRTGHKWGIELCSVKKKFKYPTKATFQTKKKFLKWFMDLDLSTREKILGKAQLTEKDLLAGKEQKWKATEADKLYRCVVELEKTLVKADMKFKAAKARYHLKKKYFSFGANASVGAVSAKGKVGASLAVGSEVRGEASTKLSASVAALQSRVKMTLGSEKLHLYARGTGKVASASASAYGGVGKIKVYNNEGEEVDAKGVAGMLSAQAALVEAETSGGISIFGIRIGASLSVQGGGFGGTIGGYATGTSVGASFGALFGIGLKLSVNVDWSGFLTWWKGKKEKDKLKKARRKEMNSRMGIGAAAGPAGAGPAAAPAGAP